MLDVVNHYNWRYKRHPADKKEGPQATAKQWRGLDKTDGWQDKYFDAQGRLDNPELKLWLSADPNAQARRNDAGLGSTRTPVHPPAGPTPPGGGTAPAPAPTPKPAPTTPAPAKKTARKTPAKKAPAKKAAKAPAKKTAAKAAPVKKTATKKTAVKKTVAKKTPAKKTAAKKTTARPGVRKRAAKKG